jgi:hypothetical protein
VEWVGGGLYNSSAKRWEGDALKPDSLIYSKFTLTTKFVQTRPVLTFDRTENLDDYNVFISPLGSGLPLPRDCEGNNESGIVTMRLRAFRCSASVLDFIFDLNANRFLQIHAIGYFNGKNDNDSPPYIAGGTCTKIR